MIERFQSDNGGEFNDVEEWATKEKGIRWVRTGPKRPETDGLVESNNNTVQQEVAKVMAEKKTKLWHKVLPGVIGK